nr:unnamed protein product [Digitaria exilis]
MAGLKVSLACIRRGVRQSEEADGGNPHYRGSMRGRWLPFPIEGPVGLTAVTQTRPTTPGQSPESRDRPPVDPAYYPGAEPRDWPPDDPAYYPWVEPRDWPPVDTAYYPGAESRD